MPRYAGDPRSLEAKYPGTCCTCGKAIRKGERIAYWPNGRKVYCWPCGEQPLREAQSEMAQEDGQYFC